MRRFALLPLLALTACATTPPGGADQQQVVAMLQESTVAWNDYALMPGKWAVMDMNTGQETRQGDFSRTWMRTPQGWRIIHDHSS